ncbi:ATP-dependent RNA helicase DbpA [compost metagenome]
MLRRVIRHFDPARTIVFINSTDNIAEVEAKMNYVGLSAGALYGDADKIARSTTLRRFRDGKYRVLVASDIAARGLDIEELELVVNLDPPIDTDHYVHRVGRTGRMGRKGLAVSIITPKEQFIIRKFAKELGIDIAPREMYEGKVREPKSFSPGPGRGKGQSGKTANSVPGRARHKDSEQDRKNKGAPKWLKSKQNKG